MLKQLDKLADRSCWISGDRINACIAVDAHGIAEIGYHGAQPVSRNSRMLVRDQGVLSLGIIGSDGREEAVPLASVDWHPHKVSVETAPWGRRMHLEILATPTAILITVTGEVGGCQLVATFAPDACTTQVRGERTWDTPAVGEHWLSLKCRDRIRLREWVRQEGPYAGDFLIPEPRRRELFNRAIRSGQATAADLRPEYRDADLLLYDACTFLRIGGDTCTIEQRAGQVRFLVPLKQDGSQTPALIIEGADRIDGKLPGASEYREAALRTQAIFGTLEERSPRLSADALPELAEWFMMVPGIVQSCAVADVGMTRGTPGAYYWLWAWDNMVTGMESFRWGEQALAANMVRFINTHRDIDGSIPARWTRSAEPLDTPPRGALEFLLLHLAYQHALETGKNGTLLDVYPQAVIHLQEIVRQSDGKGLVPNMSFYPDLPLRFGRTDRSVVALETGCLYGLTRVLENVATLFGDHHIQELSRTLARSIENRFLETFWNQERGFLVDAVDAETGVRNATYPLFSLLFLQTPLGMPLIRSVLPQVAQFVQHHLQTPYGTRMLPSWDIRQGGEEATASWYPHWDLYLLKILRRAGEADGIMRWLQAAQRVLRHLGYVPEFLVIDGLAEGHASSWLRHGAVSNLNCETGWYRGVLEGLFGLEMDPGGMSVVPLSLPLGSLRLRGLCHRRALWDVHVEHDGPALSEVRIDGKLLRGTTKVPSAYAGEGDHELVVHYGHSSGGPRFHEILNAEILESEGDKASCAVRIRALGTVDIAIAQAKDVECALDSTPMELSVDPRTGIGAGRIISGGLHTITLQSTR